MKRVEMTKFNEEGNCLEACVASLLEVEIAEVPGQPQGNGQEHDDEFLEYHHRLNRWLAQQGWQLLQIPVLGFNPADALLPDAYWIATVTTPFSDAWHHAVIARGVEVAWDPDPRANVVALTAENLKQMGWLVPVASELKGGSGGE